MNGELDQTCILLDLGIKLIYHVFVSISIQCVKLVHWNANTELASDLDARSQTSRLHTTYRSLFKLDIYVLLGIMIGICKYFFFLSDSHAENTGSTSNV